MTRSERKAGKRERMKELLKGLAVAQPEPSWFQKIEQSALPTPMGPGHHNPISSCALFNNQLTAKW